MTSAWRASPLLAALGAAAATSVGATRVAAGPTAHRAAGPRAEIGVAVGVGEQPQLDAIRMAAAGVGWVRADLAWSHVERSRGTYDFTPWDELVAGLAAQGIRTLLILDYGNALYQAGFPPDTEEGRTAFAAFAGAAARHFRGQVAWEIWNEPNVHRFWVGAPDPVAYVALARATGAAIRREDPEAWVLGPALGGESFDLAYLEATFRSGLLEIVDATSVHPYAAAQPEAAAAFYAEVRRLMRLQGLEVPLVVTEWGYPALGLGADAQADYLLRALAVNREARIPLTIWFSWQDPVIPWHSFGLLDVRGYPKPAYQALKRVARAPNPPGLGAESTGGR